MQNKIFEVLIIDVDGVMTDGRFYYNEDGKFAKVFGAVAGAAIGTIAGDVVGKSALNKSGQELIVVINSKTYTVLQETDSRMEFKTGDYVWVIGDLSSRSNYSRPSSNTNCSNGIRIIKKG